MEKPPNKTPQAKLDRNKAYRVANREAVLYHKRNNRLRRFGLQPEDLDRMLTEQQFKCAVCDNGPLLREGRSAMSSHIDHCHDCGQVRALVCKRCNALLGFIESDFGVFTEAVKYHLSHVALTSCMPSPTVEAA